MNELSFLVKGSASDPYEATFLKEGNNLTALCTCMAGQNGQYCKHRFRILDGVTADIVSDNLSDVATVQSWLIGSDVEEAIMELAQAEKLVDTDKKAISAAKKKVARAMRQ